MLRLIRQGRISKWFSGYGQEAVAVGCALGLERTDYILPMHRNTGVWTTRGVELRPLFCQLLGKAGGFTGGRDRTYHFGLPEQRIIGMISHMAAMLPVACGLGLASVLRKELTVALCFAGDGGTREGDFHEAASLAGLWKLPVIFVVENNGYGLSTPVEEAVPIEDIADAAAGYGMEGVVVDGNDILEVTAAVRHAAARARSGDGPTLLEMKTFRMRGHEEASGTAYVPDEQLERWRHRDPVHRLERRILDDRVMSEGALADIRERTDERVRGDLEWALEQPDPESSSERERSAVWAASPPLRSAGRSASSSKRFVDAVSDGLRQAMEQDDAVLILGQDVAEYGGVFKVTEGFVEQFGHDRVHNTPIIESGAVGMCLGLALEGFKPVLELQYADFLSCGFNQIVNNLATTHYRWGASVNVTIRAAVGGGLGAGPFHSQSNEAWFCHVPGLKVVYPSCSRDAKGLLMRAIQDPSPVLFFEHKLLYRTSRGDVPDEPFEIEIGAARVVREGTDATIVTYGMGSVWALEAAERRAADLGQSLEIVDLRTLVPWDRDTVLRSVRKTNRLLVLHEAPRHGGFGAEIGAEVAEAAFEWLDAPPVRIGGASMPVPASKCLEDAVYSARGRLKEALDDVLTF